MKAAALFLSSLMLLSMLGQNLTAEETKPQVVLDLQIENVSLFEGLPARVDVVFPENEVELENMMLPRDTDDISFLRQEVTQVLTGKVTGTEVSLMILPRKAGLVMIPALSWETDVALYRTQPKQVSIGGLKKSDAMQLRVTPVKSAVYAGEPLRVDVEWSSRLPAASLRQLIFNPSFMHRAGVEMDIPRQDGPEELQVGLPVAGRRIIARRVVPEKSDELGRIQFSIYLKFSEAGEVAFDATRLEVFRLLGSGGRFAPYAAYFNNTLFESVAADVRCEYLFVEAEPFQINVLPLPIPATGTEQAFSGLFAPCRFETKINTSKCDVGQLMELSVRVYSDASAGFLELPDLRQQVGLQHRFWVESEPRRIWHPDGAEFIFRFRPLTTTIQAFPALGFQVFNPQSARYEYLQTSAIPLEVLEVDGRTYFELEPASIEKAGLTDQPDGIWHNESATRTSDLMNTIINSMADGFWLWLLVTTGVAAALVPWLKERRRRAIDPVYGGQVKAYAAFSRLSNNTTPESKRAAFRAYLAALGQKSERAYTVGDAREWLTSHGAATADIETVMDLFQQEDAAKFDRKKSTITSPELDALAKRIFKPVQQEVK